MEITNYMPGPRGVNLKDGSTVWIDPGQTVMIDDGQVQGKLPDFGKPANQAQLDGDQLDALRQENEELRDQLAAAQLTISSGDASALQAANAQIADLQSQVQALQAQLDSANSGGGSGSDATTTPPKLPGLTGKTKAELLEIAAAEGVEVEDGATNNDIVAAIELHREAAQG